ncbi:MAG TPA: hypothetical protein VLU46_10860, partial [Thermoanaerobaculia bacterium]|nr:hypothetical protein [Thermoanaerobaculia bacterium]
DWMMRTDRAAFFAFVDEVESGKPAAVAFRERFRAAPGTAEAMLTRSEVRPSAIVSVRVDPKPAPPVVEAVQHDDVVIDLASFLGTFEATRGDAERFLRSVDQNARAVAALADMRSRDKRYDEATKLFERALELEPQNAAIKLSFAESLLGNAIGPFAGTSDVEEADVPRFQRARQLASEAMSADEARANAVVGTSYLAESDAQPGIEPLERAYAARPNRFDVGLNLCALLLRTNQRERAEALYAQIVATAKTPQAVFASKAVLVREQLALTNRLLATSRTDEAIAVLKQLIDRTSDANAKADLQKQMMKIVDLRDANRQITTYNEAIHASNAGDVKKAIAILDDLLKTATDAKVISDATEFRAKLQKRVKRNRR